MYVFVQEKLGGCKQKTYPSWIKGTMFNHAPTERNKNPLEKLHIQLLCHTISLLSWNSFNII